VAAPPSLPHVRIHACMRRYGRDRCQLLVGSIAEVISHIVI
jgi:hypothetical protein